MQDFLFGVADGARTHDNIEPVTPDLEGRCSIRLSYGRSCRFVLNFLCGRGGGIRTHDPLLPKQMR